MNPTNNPKLGKIEENCSCLVGTPYIENGVCKCSDTVTPITTVTPIKGSIRNYEITNNFEKTLAQLLGQQQPVVVNQNTATGSGIADFISENKWLVFGGVALLGYILLTGGLAASDKTVTSVTRYSPRSK